MRGVGDPGRPADGERAVQRHQGLAVHRQVRRGAEGVARRDPHAQRRCLQRGQPREVRAKLGGAIDVISRPRPRPGDEAAERHGDVRLPLVAGEQQAAEQVSRGGDLRAHLSAVDLEGPHHGVLAAAMPFGEIPVHPGQRAHGRIMTELNPPTPPRVPCSPRSRASSSASRPRSFRCASSRRWTRRPWRRRAPRRDSGEGP